MNSTSTSAAISALVVVAVLGILAVVLFNRSSADTAIDASSPTSEAVEGVDTTNLESDTAGVTAVPEPEEVAQQPEPTVVEVVPTPEAPPAPELSAPVIPEESEVIDGRPPFTIDVDKQYTATIETPRGNIVIQLYPKIAPQSVNSFVALARDGFYDGLTWHRVIPGFMAQGGDPTGTGTGGPGYSLPAEFTDEILYDRPGIVAMARSADPNSAGSQFFITTAPATHLNYQYTVFGEVIEGQEIVNSIPVRDPAAASTPGEAMMTITIEES